MGDGGKWDEKGGGPHKSRASQGWSWARSSEEAQMTLPLDCSLGGLPGGGWHLGLKLQLLAVRSFLRHVEKQSY